MSEARHYLETELPRLLASSPVPRLAKPAVIQFVIVDRPDCDFAYTIAGDGVAVSREIADEVDLTISFVAADLLAFKSRKLDVERALRTRRMKVLGDVSLLAFMAERLANVALAPGSAQGPAR
jgi:predicted lipid carrier protein YhbT